MGFDSPRSMVRGGWKETRWLQERWKSQWEDTRGKLKAEAPCSQAWSMRNLSVDSRAGRSVKRGCSRGKSVLDSAGGVVKGDLEASGKTCHSMRVVCSLQRLGGDQMARVRSGL